MLRSSAIIMSATVLSFYPSNVRRKVPSPPRYWRLDVPRGKTDSNRLPRSTSSSAGTLNRP